MEIPDQWVIKELESQWYWSGDTESFGCPWRFQASVFAMEELPEAIYDAETGVLVFQDGKYYDPESSEPVAIVVPA